MFSFWGEFYQPSKQCIRVVENKLFDTFSLLVKIPQTEVKEMRSEENIVTVEASVEDDSNL